MIKYLLGILLLLVISENSVSQTYSIAGLIGPRTSNAVDILGHDENYFYNIFKALNKNGTSESWTFEERSIDNLEKKFSFPIVEKDIDENLLRILNTSYCKAGLVVFYIKYVKSEKTFSLMMANLKVDEKPHWIKSLVFEESYSKSIGVHFDVFQNEDGSFFLASTKRKPNSSYTIEEPDFEIAYYDENLNQLFKKNFSFESEHAHLTRLYQDNNKNLFVIYLDRIQPSNYFMSKLLFINTKTGESNRSDLWDFEEKDQQRTIIDKKDYVFCNDDAGNTIMSTQIVNEKKWGTNQSTGIAILKVDKSGSIIAKEKYSWNKSISEKGVLENYSVYSIAKNEKGGNNVILNCVFESHGDNSSYIYNYEILSVETDGQSIAGSCLINRSGILLSRSQTDFSSQIMIRNGKKTFLLYNQEANTLAKKEPARIKDPNRDTRAAISQLNGGLNYVENDLNLVIEGDNECQIQPLQSFAFAENQILTIAATDDNLYFLKISLNK